MRTTRLPASLLLAIALSMPATAQVDFNAARSSSSETYISAEADFDEDGYPDLVVGWAVALNDRHGGFAPSQRLPDPYAYFAHVGDVNGDGHVDLVGTATQSVQTVVVALGDGHAGFATPISTPIPRDSSVVVLADFNGDGRLDIATVVRTERFYILLGDGLGSFGPATAFNLFNVLNLVAADFDEDGNLDLIATTTGILFLRGDGLGGFGSPSSIGANQQGSALLAADLDLDGHLDVEAGSLILFGDGTGGFPRMRDVLPGFNPDASAAGDLNADGQVDLVFMNLYLGLSVLVGQGAGVFTERERFSLDRTFHSFVLNDFDRDGRLDVALSSEGYGYSAVILLSRGDGQGNIEGPRPVPMGMRLYFGVAADLNEDGHIDVIAPSSPYYGSSDVLVVIGDGAGGLTRLGALPMRQYESIAGVADFDGDGHVDLIGYLGNEGYPPTRLEFWRGDGTGAFTLTGSPNLERFHGGAFIADLNQDGIPDLAYPDLTSSPPVVRILAGDGAGGFTPVLSLVTAADSSKLVTADFNEDGRTDLAASGCYGSVTVFLADSAGGFGFGRDYVTYDGCTCLTGDFDGDGHQDIALAGGHSVWFLRGDGTGRFSVTQVDPGSPTHNLASGDLNGDSIPDLLVGTEAGAVAIVADGRGGFSVSPSFGILSYGGIIDLDEDGLAEVVTGGATGFEVFSNQTFGLAEYGCRAGNVNAASGPPANVLSVNGSTGRAGSRLVSVGRNDPFQIRMDAPPSNPSGPAPFVLYLWQGLPTAATGTALPFGLGSFCLPAPLSGGNPQPILLANNIGFAGALGRENWPGPATHPAPSTVASFAHGVRRPGVFFLQGLIPDRQSRSGRAAVTNAIEVVSR